MTLFEGFKWPWTFQLDDDVYKTFMLYVFAQLVAFALVVARSLFATPSPDVEKMIPMLLKPDDSEDADKT